VNAPVGHVGGLRSHLAEPFRLGDGLLTVFRVPRRGNRRVRSRCRSPTVPRGATAVGGSPICSVAGPSPRASTPTRHCDLVDFPHVFAQLASSRERLALSGKASVRGRAGFSSWPGHDRTHFVHERLASATDGTCPGLLFVALQDSSNEAMAEATQPLIATASTVWVSPFEAVGGNERHDAPPAHPPDVPIRRRIVERTRRCRPAFPF